MGATTEARRRPKDSMVSTWREDKSKWHFSHYIINMIDYWHGSGTIDPPVFSKDDPVPYMSQWSANAFIIIHALWPMALQTMYYRYMGTNLHPAAVYLLYSSAFKLNSIAHINAMRRVAKITGFFDGDKHARDKVPDVGVDKVLMSLEITTTIRPMFAIFLAYHRDQPVALSWWLPVELFLYSIVLDFFFYAYHRACHELDGLWQYHRTHHLTKHPIPLLTAYSDFEQEMIELVLLPVITYGCLKAMGFPMGFYDWWVCHQYLIFAEAFGHSGLRVWAFTPGTSSPILRLIGAELVMEDHDLHHRHGWKHSANYGKQTRLWDLVFGTKGQRIESRDANVDFTRRIDFPLL